MRMPFTIDQFLNVFKDYNQSVFPLQIIFYLLAFGSIYLIFKKNKIGSRIISAVLTFLWLWIGIIYHWLFFTTINQAAYVFGLLFVVQGIMFLVYGVIKNGFSFNYTKSGYNFAGVVFLIYALLIYPVWGQLSGHQYPYSPTFGLPCPTVIFTFGILMFVEKKIPVWLLVIPFLWSLLGFSAAVQLKVYEDFGLLAAGITAVIMLIKKNKKNPAAVSAL